MSGASERPQWAVERNSETPIVARIASAPALEGLPPRERRKLKIGEPFHFALDVIVEPTGAFSKRAFVPGVTPAAGDFEIFCDEGKELGSEGAAPTPLAYFTAGAALCLMTHITGFLRFTDLKVRKLRVEMRANYMTKLGHVDRGGQGEGGAVGFETFVIVDSDEPPERIQNLVSICEKACIASQTIAQAVPTSVSVLLNGNAV